MRKPNQLWNSLRNMYQSFCTGSTPVTWVNPDMMNELPSVTYSEPYIPENQFLSMEPGRNGDAGGCLWYAAPPEGSHLQFMDPLHVWQQKIVFPYESVPQPCFTNFPDKKSKPSRPLNPEAKEWIPKEMREKKEPSFSSQDCFSSNKDSCGKSPKETLNSTVCQDFCEITEGEIAAIRNTDKSIESCSVSLASPKKQDGQIVLTENSHCDKSVIKTENINTAKSSSIENSENTPISYAVVAKKVLSSPEPPRAKSPNEKPQGINQTLPKIFLKDKRYPKEKAAPLMEKSVHTLPFKTANKVQKKNSRKFLNELKASAQAESSDCGSLCSESSFGSPCSDSFPQRLCHGNTLVPSGSPSWEKVKGLCAAPESRSPRPQRSISECSSSNSRIRSTSESSVASIDSINIEFEDEVDKNNSLGNVCIISENCQPKCVDNTKLSNSVLAHILGLNDCKSEESDEEWDDSDSDWDDVQNDSTGLDESWETFGLGLTIPVACKVTTYGLNNERKETDIESSLNADQNCDILDEEEDAFSCNLAEVNKHWNEEVEKDVSRKTDQRVSFGAVKEHPMVTWAYAYRQARRGPWEQYARDAARFSRHIAELEPVISPVLQEKHRQGVYRKLYGDSSS